MIGAAVEQAAAELATRDAPAEQLTMFQVPTRFSGDRAEHLQRALETRRNDGPGRPAGSENKATADFRKYLLGRGKSPLESLMQWSLHTPTTLAAELQCSRLEAFEMLLKVWADLSPYLHSKLAPSDDAGKAVPFLNVTLGAHASAGVELPPWAYLSEVQQNKALPASTEPVSHEPASHEGGK